ncbi:hypothetical protein CTAYLR_003109 [Chrysophaeum taylorii]|uniref:ACT domain-containing protein n=1 Tax=Chrysophaeum taylorii TaxID=2483200 RepID=A0AAD7XHL4_9STRA|nr:hypothetical protein CTAYLR_003109 [Chrysophaeum taylorii]
MAAAVLRLARSKPFAFGVGFSCVKTSVSDLIVQVGVERREEIDWRRNASFAAFGFGYLGIVQYTLYVPVFGRLFPGAAAFAAKPLRDKLADPKGLATLAAQVFLDQCVHHPFAYFPAFYATKELVTRGNVELALSKWKENFWADLQALWQVWVPATILNFAFSPMWLRIPVVASTSLLWTMILSTMRGKTHDVEQGVAVHSDILLEEGEVEDPILGAHVSARTMELFRKGLARRNTSAETHFVVTASGADRVGLVNKLAHRIYEGGGSIAESKMMRIEDDFTIVMHVTAPKGTSLKSDIMDFHPLDKLEVRAREVGVRKDKPVARLRLTGKDRPGIVFEITQIFTSLGYNIDELNTDTVPGNWFLLELFASHASFQHSSSKDKVLLETKLNQIQTDLDLKLDLSWVKDH